MRPFEFGAQLPPNDDDHYEFNFASPVTANVLDIRMPVPMRPWRGFAPPSESNAFASGSDFQPQQSLVNANDIQRDISSQLPSSSRSSFQLQQSLIDANNRQHDIPPQLPSSSVSGFQPQQSFVNVNNPHYYVYPQLQSNHGPETPGYLVPPAYHPILNERQPLGSFFPDFSQTVPSMDNDVLLPVGTEYRDEPRRERIFGVEGSPGQIFNRKRKGRGDKPDTEYTDRLPQKRIRLKKSIANAPTMLLADAEQSAVPSQPVAAPAVSFPDISELSYNPANSTHKKIVSSATKAIKTHLINTQSLSTHLERRHWVETRLEESATKQYRHPEFGRNWSLGNSTTLYMELSDPCKTLMQTCKRIARSKVVLYGLRPGVWSTADERQFRANRIEGLLSKGTFPPRFTLGADEFGNLHFLENEVVWHVLLDTVAELRLRRYIDNLDSLFCLAAAAVRCALNELNNDQFVHIEFTAENYQEFYNSLLNYLKRMSSDPVFLARWELYKTRTSARLAQLC